MYIQREPEREREGERERERERERETFTRSYIFLLDFQSDSNEICQCMGVRACSLSFPPLLRRWWPNDFPRKLSEKKTEATINLLLVGLLAPAPFAATVGTVLRQWSQSHAWKPYCHGAHVFFGVGPFILHWFPHANLPSLSSDRVDGRLHSIAIRYWYFRKCAVCDFPSETSVIPYPRFEMRYV